MTIKKLNIGPHCKKTVYQLTEDGDTVASFTTLEDAALVLRYITGGNLRDADLEDARAIMSGMEAKNE